MNIHNIKGKEINPATEENLTDGTQKTQIVYVPNAVVSIAAFDISTQYIPSAAGIVMANEKIVFEMKSEDLSAETAFSPEISIGGTNFDVATESGIDITDSLKQNETKVVVYEGKPGLTIRLAAVSGKTGSLAVKILN